MKENIFGDMDNDEPLKIYMKLMSKLRNIVREAEIELEVHKDKKWFSYIQSYFNERIGLSQETKNY